MDIDKLFNGIVVMIDDEIDDEKTPIYTIRESIKNRNFPIATYKDIPPLDIIPALSNSSFIVLDWDYSNLKPMGNGGERIAVGDAFIVEQENKLIEFIRTMMDTIFVPIFIFTFKKPEDVKAKLRKAKLWQKGKTNRIFIKQKNEILTEAALFEVIEEWLKEMPSVYALKEWEQTITTTKNKMFIEFYNYSPHWSKIIWDMLKLDTVEHHREYGDFITRNLCNRIEEYQFLESILNVEKDVSSTELSKVLEGERYLKYDKQPEQVYTGDLFKVGERYLLNIRAQCAIAKRDPEKEYNPTMYCIKGEKLGKNSITTGYIELTNENQLIMDKNNTFTFDKLVEICKDKEELEKLNKKFKKHRDNTFFRKGAFLERNDKVIIGCIAGKQAIQFDLDLELKCFSELKDKRIGRIMPPYITHIQHKCAQYMIREGIMPIPKELIED